MTARSTSGKCPPSKGVSSAVNYIKKYLSASPAVAIILGSGLDMEIRTRTTIPYGDIPGIPVPSVKGHTGVLALGEAGGVNVLALKGRVHIYEGYSARDAAAPVFILAGLGVARIIVTNSSGGINRRYSPGNVMFVTDHINLLGESPLRGPCFVDMTRPYEMSLADDIRRLGRRHGLRVRRGVLAAVRGPAYETPAEVRMLRRLGADAVCMSTIPEVIAAKSCGMKVVGVSFIANMAADHDPLFHHDVLKAAKKRMEALSLFFRDIVRIFAQR